jgi:hypothetical protein
MRKVILAAAVAALGSAVLAGPATASFDSHFRVFEKARFHLVSDGQAFTIRGGLFDPRNRDDRVGRDRGFCKLRPGELLKCRGKMHFSGEIGGSGDIRYRGNVRPGHERLNVTGGSGDFNGVAGKWVFENVNKSGTKSLNHFALVR